MAQVFPIIITHPLRNKVCIFPTEDDCELSSNEINSIIRRNPYSFNNIFYKPYIKRLQGIKKYKAIKRQYQKFKKNNIIKTGENPVFYIYNIIDNEKNEYYGIVGQIPHSEFEAGNIHKIEKSLSKSVDDKYNQIDHIRFTAKPITVVHETIDAISEIINKYKSKIPLYEFTRNNGYIHEVWQVVDPEHVSLIQEAYRQTNKFYIIDDNNNFEALHRIYKKSNSNGKHFFSGQEAFNFFPAFLISQNQVKIHEYKKGLPVEFSRSVEEVLKILQKNFKIELIDNYDLPQKGELLLYTLKGKYLLIPKKHIDTNLPDSFIFEQYILPEITDNQQLISYSDFKFCDGKRSAKCVENQLNKENCKMGFIIRPMDFDEIENAVAKNIKIPYKSLYVEPRLLKGLFIYEI